MRILAPSLVAGMIAAGGAQASSIVAVEAIEGTASPSIVVLEALPRQGVSGSTVVAAPLDATPSIIALGEPAVADENVAAIPTDSKRNPEPTVIRGGDVGDAFATPVPIAPQAPDAQIEDLEGAAEDEEFDPTQPPREPSTAELPSPSTRLPE